MIYSAACEYAVRALTLLARDPGGLVLQRAIAEREGIPLHFLGKILQDLVKAGLVASAKGPGGGFRLARPPAEVTLHAIKRAIDGPLSFQRCVLGLPHCSDEQPCSHHEVWRCIRAQIEAFLQRTTLSELVDVPRPAGGRP